MRTLIVLGFVVVGLSVSVGVLSYTLVPGLIESRLATNLQERYGLEKEPEVEIFSSFPPKLLVGRIDRIEVLMKELRRQGIRLRDVRITVKDADVSVISLLRGDIEREIRTASLVAEAPEKSINEYLGENDLGLEDGKIDVRPQEVVYRSADALLGSSASISLELKVAGPYTIEVVPKKATITARARTDRTPCRSSSGPHKPGRRSTTTPPGALIAAWWDRSSKSATSVSTTVRDSSTPA